MGCRSDYMEPTVKERQRRHAATLLKFVLSKIKGEWPEWVQRAANDQYGAGGEQAMAELCQIMTAMDEKEREELVYGDPRDKMARKLADWWEQHQEEDRKRKEIEAAAARTPENQLADIKMAVWEYFRALDNRDHGGIAQNRAFGKICKVLDMHWHHGITKEGK